MANASAGAAGGRDWAGAYAWPDLGTSAPALPDREESARGRRAHAPSRGSLTLEHARRRAQAGAALREFLRTAGTVAVVFVMLAAVVARANVVIREGYRVDALKQSVQQAQDEHDRLAAAVARAVAPANVARVATGQMDMTAAPAPTARISVEPAPSGAEASRTATHSRTVALAPKPAPDRTLWVALNEWFDSWFSNGAVEAREQAR